MIYVQFLQEIPIFVMLTLGVVLYYFWNENI